MKLTLLTTLLGAVTIFAAVSVHAQGQQDIWLVNGTGRQIDSIYISPHAKSEWGPDRLAGDQVLPDGQKEYFSFSGYSTCRFDLAVRFHDGSRWTWTDGTNLCNITGVEIEDDATMHTFSGQPD